MSRTSTETEELVSTATRHSRGAGQRGQVFRAALTTAIAVAGASAFGADTQTAQALAAYEGVRSVLQHPRCQNCHIPGDAPLQFDSGLTHAQGVQRGAAGTGNAGMQCATCHGKQNLPAAYGAHVPPGAPNWHLPPPSMKMVFIGLSPRELCLVIKDPQRTGGRNLQAMLEHVDHDKLVAWGWNPGPGRTLPPLTHEQFVSVFREWISMGAPCPDQ
jgi:hypothetical protein